MLDETENLVGDLYEASVVIEKWPQVLEALTEVGGGAGASFISAGPGPMRWKATPEIEALITDYANQPHINPRIAMGVALAEPGFKTDLDILPPSIIEKDPFYTQFMRPRDLGWCVATAIHAPASDSILFAVERRYSSGPPDRSTIDRLDRLRPHLARSLLLSCRLGLDRARVKAEALAAVGYPAAVLDDRGRLYAANALLSEHIPLLLQDRRERAVLTDDKADKLLKEALGRLQVKAEAIQSFPMVGRAGFPTSAIHVIPIRGIANDFFTGASSIVLITPAVVGSMPDSKILEALFDLTPAEARVAKFIAAADSLDTIAKNLSVGRETVRKQLQSVFYKTGTTRQAELTRILATMPSVSALDRLR